ncbi:hypothetical protein GEV43_09775 [Actinomadura sp. J1-007]|nr:hypothetical protein [Actinomadura sp. J1-007]
MKALVLGVAAVLMVGAAAAVAYVTLIDSKELRYKTQASLRGALPTAAAAELRARGISLKTPLSCTDVPGWTKRKMRASCTGTTDDKRTVHVIGSGEDATRANYYTILVGGRPLVQNATCLGGDCKKKPN